MEKEALMKDQSIGFPTAKLAKEKGYEVYHPFGMKNMAQYFKPDGIKLTTREILDNPDAIEQSYLQTSQSLLQKWLREVKKINVDAIDYRQSNKPMKFFTSVNLYDENNNFIKEVYNTTDRYHNGSKKKQLFFKTYEEALEKGLQEALKLIK
jgi:hypothetical protein